MSLPILRPPFVLLDFARSGSHARGLLFHDPVAVLVADRLDEVRPLLDAAETATREGNHAVGFVSYDAAPAFDPAFVVNGRTSLPLAWFGIFAAPVTHTPALPNVAASQWIPDTGVAAHAAAVEDIRAAIGRGEVYQVNHTIRLRSLESVDPLALYDRMREAQPDGYCAFIGTGRHCIASASPELFFHRRGDTITTQPMKGTARRGRWVEEDDAAARALAESEKERAENVMIVDLLRNDLGRIARPGTVRVPRLFDVERHPTVLQMTSTIEAELEPGTTLGQIFGALFPCGSVTGAPKIAAMKKIAALERSPRGAYCGTLGWLAPSGESTFSVAIRTASVDREDGIATYGVGGGITWDSEASAEFEEVRAKCAVVTTAMPRFELLETMRLTRDGYVRHDRHVARLIQSARYFGIPADARRIERALDAHAGDATEFPRRVRLLVAPDGTPRVEDRALLDHDPAAPPQTVALATSPVSSADRFLFHKTTHRVVYERHRAEHPHAFDVLLWNERDELTEFTIGNVVLRIDGIDWTPPRQCGLLAGTFRAELLDQGAIRERPLHLADLHRAEAAWLINSLREWVPVIAPEVRGA